MAEKEPGELTQRRVPEGICKPRATEINRKVKAIEGHHQLRHLKMALVRVTSVELWRRNTVLDLRGEKLISKCFNIVKFASVKLYLGCLMILLGFKFIRLNLLKLLFLVGTMYMSFFF